MEHKKEFLEIIKAHEGIIYKVTKVYACSQEDAQDLYQEIVYQLWKSLASFRNESKISTWIYRIALNTCITNLNKAKRKAGTVPVYEELLQKTDIPDHYKEEQIEVLYAAIKKLNSIEKGIILLYLEGNNYDEIAIITGFTTTNIGTRLGRIKQKLKNQIIK